MLYKSVESLTSFRYFNTENNYESIKSQFVVAEIFFVCSYNGNRLEKPKAYLSSFFTEIHFGENIHCLPKKS